MMACGFITLCAVMLSLCLMIPEKEPEKIEESPLEVEIEIEGVKYYGVITQDKAPKPIRDHG
jgi:hypothetical protein